MFSKISVSRVFSVLLVVLILSGTASAIPLNAPLGTGFTYQGRLTDGGAPANGTYDLEFKLYDALSGGSQVGSTVSQGDVTVSDGLFTVQLDFGNVFDGTALYLEIGVRPGASDGAYTPLTPRQALTATPYAIYASKAPWSGLTGVPAGFADGTDDGATYTAGSGLSLAGTEFSVTGAPWSGLTGVPAGFADGVDNTSGSAYQNVKTVAKSGGDYTTIQAALDSIIDASASNHYLIYVAPGVYTETVTMKPYVDIEGAGELTTKITHTGSASSNTGTVVGASDAELRFLTVENTGDAACAIAIYNSSASPRLTHVTASASWGMLDNYGVYNDSSSPTMTNVTASASGGMGGRGVYNASSSPVMTNVTASASGGMDNSGVSNNSSSSPVMTNVTASASGGAYNRGVNNSSSSPVMTNVTASASGGEGMVYNYGVCNYASSPTMTNVTASASGGTNYNYGVYNASSSPTMTNVTASASGGTDNYGIYNDASSGAYTVRVNNSQITGSTNTIYNDSEFTTRIGASQLSGGVVSVNGGTVTCIGVYDENYASPDYTTCP